MAACSHRRSGLKVTEDGSVLEVDDGGWLQGRRRGRYCTMRPCLRQQRAPSQGQGLWKALGPGSRMEEFSRKEGGSSHVRGDPGVETDAD
jgi:hypothetical protein